jgi:Tfp pilus assembly protein PilN
VTAPQTLQAAPLTSGTSPRVNLMPPEIAEAARFRQVQAALGAALALVVVLVALLYLNAHGKVSSAKSELAQAQQQNSSLQAKLSSLASVQQTFNAVEAREALLAQAMGTEVRWSVVLSDLSIRMPSNVWLTHLGVSESATGATSAPTTTQSLGAAAPAAATGPLPIGALTISGVGLKHDDVAAWLDAMAKESKFSNPTFTNSTEGTIGTHDVVNFSGGMVLNSSALSNRYVAPDTSQGSASSASTTTGSVPGTGTVAP